MLDVQIRKRLATGRKSGDSFSLDVSLSCATRRLVLFGHSGSGKTLTLQSLAGLVRPGGRLSIAHGMSRAALDAHHSSSAKPVSLGLLHEDEVRALMAPYLDVDTVISNGEMYQVCGRKRA